MTASDLTLCLVADEAFAPGACATLTSVAASLSSPGIAYVVDVGLSPESRRRLAGTGVPVVRIQLSDEQRRLLADGRSEGRHGQVATYTRLLIADLLPADVNRAIYLDADTLVLHDISELARHDLAGKTMGAVNDPFISGMYTRQLLGGDPKQPLKIPRYFNAGVLVVDLEKWRIKGIGERLLVSLTRHQGLTYHDQDHLNLTLQNDWTELPENWNRLVPSLDMQLAPSSLAARQGMIPRHALLEGASIAHFVGSRKPWSPTALLEPELLDIYRRYCATSKSTETSWSD